MRELNFEPGFTRHAEGSCLVSFGDTRVLCTASVEDKVPPFLRGKGQGWVTAEYGMLPRATHTRGNREAAKGKQSGRTQEIQRLIGRSLRAVVDLPSSANARSSSIATSSRPMAAPAPRRSPAAGSRFASRSTSCSQAKALAVDPIRTQVAAVSCGIHNGTPVLDLDYDEDSQAGSDGNFVLTADGAIVEAQLTAEGETFDEEGLLRLLRLARIGCVGDFRGAAEGDRPMRPIGDKLVIATHNPGKLREIAALLEPLGIACVGAEELGLPEPEEIGNTFADNADLKAREAADLSRPAGARRRQRPVRRCAARPPGHLLGALGRGRGRQPRLDARDGEGLARGRSGRARRRAGRAFRLRAGDRLAQRRPGRDVRRPGRRHARLAAARRPRLRLRPDVRAGRP